MTYVWAGIIGTIVLLIIYGIVSSRLRERRLRRLSGNLLPEIHDHIKADGKYRIALTSGSVFDDVRFLGISHPQGAGTQYLPFPLQHWLVVEKPDGKRLFVRPNAVKYYEEV